MLNSIAPKLPMRSKSVTKDFYIHKLGFKEMGTEGFPDYLILAKDAIELHFFLFENLQPKENYGQVYIRVNDIEFEYQSLVRSKVEVHPNGHISTKPRGMKEFALLDPDFNLLTFGESI